MKIKRKAEKYTYYNDIIYISERTRQFKKKKSTINPNGQALPEDNKKTKIIHSQISLYETQTKKKK